MSLLICSYSNADGEVNTMFSPVRSMAGDTVAIRMYFFDEWDFEYDWDIFYIVLVQETNVKYVLVDNEDDFDPHSCGCLFVG